LLFVKLFCQVSGNLKWPYFKISIFYFFIKGSCD